MDFVLPSWGGAMVHSDPQMTDSINLVAPKKNVDKVWHRNELKGEKLGTKGNGIAGNGTIAAATFNGIKDNLVIYDYNGKYLWRSGFLLNLYATISSPMVDMNHRVIACDNKRIIMVAPSIDGFKVVWKSRIPRLFRPIRFTPLSPTIVNGRTLIVPTNYGPIYAFDVNTGALLAKKYLGLGNNGFRTYFSTVNSACVHGNRVYILTESKEKTGPPRSRLYAVDVNPDAPKSKRLTEIWMYEFTGKSQASPLFIDNTLYFDGYIPLKYKNRDCRIYAVRDKGITCEEKWKIKYPHMTMFSFTKDPRCGFWYEDFRGRKLVRFSEEDGSIKEEIIIEDYVKEGIEKHKPLSCMTICDYNDPVMIISAFTFTHTHYVLAISLKDNNKLIWKVPITSQYGLNYAGGQFTILKKNENPSDNRLLFATYWDGVMAIGENK